MLLKKPHLIFVKFDSRSGLVHRHLHVLCSWCFWCNSFYDLFIVRCRDILRSSCGTIRVQASNVSVGSGGYEGKEDNEGKKIFPTDSPNDSLPGM